MNEELQFDVIQKFINEKGIVEHLISSFNYFIDEGIQKIINEENTITIKADNNMIYKYTFGEVYVTKPVIIDENRKFRKTTPIEARFKDFTYEGNLLVNIHTDVLTEDNVIIESNVIRKYQLAKIPIMFGSNRCILNEKQLTKTKEYLPSDKYKDNYGECLFEVGGYFIIRGKERVLISQERANYNTVISSLSEDGSVSSEIRSISNETGHSVLLECVVSAGANNIYFLMPFIKEKIGVGIIFQALGIFEDELMEYLCPKYIIEKMDEKMLKKWKRLIQNIINDTKFIECSKEEEGDEVDDLINSVSKMTIDDDKTNYKRRVKEATIDYLTQFILHTTDKPREYVKQILEHEIFPHLGGYSSKKDYLWLLSYIVLHTLQVYLRIIPPDSKDHLINKRIECAGTLLHDLFRTSFKRFVRSLVPRLEKYQNIQHAIQRENNITKVIRYCFLTGNWGLQKNNYVKTGVSQIFSRLSYMASLSHLRRVNMHIGKEVKNSELRQIHQSSIFFIDPAETPEGVCVGIVKNLALTASITTYICPIYVKHIVESYGLTDNINDIPILINNVCVGYTDKPHEFIDKMRLFRSKKIINYQVSISFNPTLNSISLWCDQGRFIRPIFVLPNCMNTELLVGCKTFQDYLDNNIICYLDANELETIIVAMTIEEITPQHQYLEIHPTCMLGVIGCTIPFPDHNQAPRVCYYSSMAKQTMGIYATNLPIRIDTIAHVLDYVQKPLVSTRVARMLHNDEMASGINCIMAIANYTGLNQEDCVIINKNALERGLFVSHSYRTVVIDEKRTDSYTSFITCIPDNEYKKPNYNYNKLDSNGIVKKGLFVEPNDVLVGRILKRVTRNKETYADASITVQMKEEGIVDDIFILNSPDGYKIIKIRIRALKFPELGDKVAQVSGQKGTIGLICPQENMPFTSDGIVPDIIVNSHAIPSRMTINMLLETVLGKACLINGEYGDATPFSSSSTNIVDKLCDNLEKCGYERTGYEVMYNGMTGEKLQSQIFIGPTFYHKLKHMVSDKMYARGFGSVQMLTCQPTVGRSKLGALKIGEMERDCMIGQGCSNLLVDRLYEASDPYSIHVCNKCGQIVNNLDFCEPCENTDIRVVKVPYAFKLLQKQLLALCIKTNIYSENHTVEPVEDDFDLDVDEEISDNEGGISDYDL
jgi:DNA-directed RNA polymerase II subunit RPB2